MWFGNGFLPDNENLKVINGDVRDQEAFKTVCEGQDAIIYLASISNNEMERKNHDLFYQVNQYSFMPNVISAKEAGVKRFIYASSVAAYGSTIEDAKETDTLKPTTAYGHSKAYGEYALMHYRSPEFCCTVVRSASVCGYSPAQRFDTPVNAMAHDGVRTGIIKVNGGEQKRSHISIKDIADFYRLLLKAPVAQINGEAFNAVLANQSILDTAGTVAEAIGGAVIVKKERTDDRSYTADWHKAREVLGFAPKCSVYRAAKDLAVRLKNGQWQDSLSNSHYMKMADGLA